jgi:hypothetical protein
MAQWIRTEDDELINLDKCIDIIYTSESQFSNLYRRTGKEQVEYASGKKITKSKTAGIYVTRYTQESLGGAPLYEYKCLLKSKDRNALLTAYEALIHSLTPIESYLRTFDDEIEHTLAKPKPQRPETAGKATAPQASQSINNQ